ncbi:endolytic transglycosylase MltG [Pelistega ratti]|uniref:endolytic transglycosylase MltG n=1 Tax=Pelistega ratti TaxID=2652177 RepID=UPI001358892A|nr:endolytic transglycosylase MltG [Pelistega ratti]
MKRMLKKFFLLLVIMVCAIGAYIGYQVWQWHNVPVILKNSKIDLTIPKGSSVKTVADLLISNGVEINPTIFTLYTRYTGQATQLKAGAYEIREGQTSQAIVDMMANGEMSKRSIQFIEGWTYKQIRRAIEKHPDIVQTLGDISDTELLKLLDAPSSIQSMEGLLYPDTYIFVPGDSDKDIIRRAYTQGQQYLQQEWNKRAERLPLKSPYEALILASIVEKETGHGEDRGKVAGVFTNRLNKNMPLQTDPTVIYGMGDKYQGRIRKVDLQTDTPWNTYTRNGLPPTPIASPGLLALQATLHPNEHKFLYFVSRGDGTSEFAETLSQHNRNVQKYILKKGE